MQAGHYTTSHESKRLSGQLEQRGFKSGMSALGLFLFGSIFVAMGTFIILMGTKVISVDPAKVHAPYWVLTMAGAVFAFGGLMVWSLARRQHAANRHAEEAARLYPNERALQDYKWNPNGFTPSRWAPVVKSVFGALFLIVFLSMFNWWAFVKGGPFMLKAIIGLFDCLLLLLIGYICILFGRALKFGDSQIHFLQFPYQVSEPVTVRWQAAHGIVQANKGKFTLRCVKEYFEESGTGKNRSRNMVHEQIWSGTWEFDQPRTFTLSEQLDLSFTLPGGLPPTQLQADFPIFWELEVRLDLPGLDFVQKYPVPVYGVPQGAMDRIESKS